MKPFIEALLSRPTSSPLAHPLIATPRYQLLPAAQSSRIKQWAVLESLQPEPFAATIQFTKWYLKVEIGRRVMSFSTNLAGYWQEEWDHGIAVTTRPG
jgi:hypothetical protein